MGKLYQLSDLEINKFYTEEFRKFKLYGFWDITKVVELQNQSAVISDNSPPWKHEEFMRNLSESDKKALFNKLAFSSCDAKLKNGTEVFVVPIFTAHDPEWNFDRELESKDQKPWVVFFKGNDDTSHGMRFTTEQEMQEYLALGIEVGETPLAWHN